MAWTGKFGLAPSALEGWAEGSAFCLLLLHPRGLGRQSRGGFQPRAALPCARQRPVAQASVSQAEALVPWVVLERVSAGAAWQWGQQRSMTSIGRPLGWVGRAPACGKGPLTALSAGRLTSGLPPPRREYLVMTASPVPASRPSVEECCPVATPGSLSLTGSVSAVFRPGHCHRKFSPPPQRVPLTLRSLLPAWGRWCAGTSSAPLCRARGATWTP